MTEERIRVRVPIVTKTSELVDIRLPVEPASAAYGEGGRRNRELVRYMLGVSRLAKGRPRSAREASELFELTTERCRQILRRAVQRCREGYTPRFYHQLPVPKS